MYSRRYYDEKKISTVLFCYLQSSVFSLIIKQNPSSDVHVIIFNVVHVILLEITVKVQLSVSTAVARTRHYMLYSSTNVWLTVDCTAVLFSLSSQKQFSISYACYVKMLLKRWIYFVVPVVNLSNTQWWSKMTISCPNKMQATMTMALRTIGQAILPSPMSQSSLRCVH